MSKIDKEKLALEVMDEMEKNVKVDYRKYLQSYGCSRATFYNTMKQFDIDIAEYNKSIILETDSENKVSEDSEKSFEILPRDEFFPGDNIKPKLNFDISGKKYDIIVKGDIENDKEENNIEIKSDEMYHQYNNVMDKFVIAGLISDRHYNIDSSVNLYVYRGPIRQDLIHDYDKLYEIADKFINENVIKLGYNKLKIIVTGLTQCVGAVISAAIKNNICLVLMHYNNISRKYGEQTICGDNKSNNTTSLLDLYGSTRRYAEIYLYGYDQIYYNNLKKLYIVKVEDLNNKKTIIYIFSNTDKMFDKYSKEVQKVMNEKIQSYRIMADEIQFGTTNLEFNFTNNFGTYYNKPKV